MVLVLGVGRCAFRPPRVVFVLGLVSLINSLTSGQIMGNFRAVVDSPQASFSAHGEKRKGKTK